METSVANLILNVQQLTTDMRGLLASADTGVYGESYATDSGPAVRARFFERLSSDSREMRANLDELRGGLEEQANRLSEVHGNVLIHETHITEQAADMNEAIARIEAELRGLIEAELRGLRTEARDPGARVPAARIPKIITGTKGFEKLKVYSGDATQWPDWRFKITTWLVQEIPSFETLVVKLDQCELEPTEPEEDERMAAGPSELTTDEECSE